MGESDAARFMLGAPDAVGDDVEEFRDGDDV